MKFVGFRAISRRTFVMPDRAIKKSVRIFCPRMQQCPRQHADSALKNIMFRYKVQCLIALILAPSIVLIAICLSDKLKSSFPVDKWMKQPPLDGKSVPLLSSLDFD